MNRRHFLATSPAFLAALAVSAKAAGALPVGWPGEGEGYVDWSNGPDMSVLLEMQRTQDELKRAVWEITGIRRLR